MLLRPLLEALIARYDAAQEGFEWLGDRRRAALAAALQVGRKQGSAGIARFLGITAQSAARTVDELEAAGYVHRLIRDPALGASRFGTVQAIIVTHDGVAMLSAFDDLERAIEERVLEPLGCEDRERLSTLVHRLVHDESHEEKRTA